MITISFEDDDFQLLITELKKLQTDSQNRILIILTKAKQNDVFTREEIKQFYDLIKESDFETPNFDFLKQQFEMLLNNEQNSNKEK